MIFNFTEDFNFEIIVCMVCITSPDRNGILFCCGLRFAPAVTKKIEYFDRLSINSKREKAPKKIKLCQRSEL